jgi:hypothetical protein
MPLTREEHSRIRREAALRVPPAKRRWRDGESRSCATVHFEKSEKSGLKFNMALPLLDVTIDALSVVGVVICPWLTFKETPPTLPTLATLGIVITQLFFLGLVVIKLRSVRQVTSVQVNTGSRDVE